MTRASQKGHPTAPHLRGGREPEPPTEAQLGPRSLWDRPDSHTWSAKLVSEPKLGSEILQPSHPTHPLGPWSDLRLLPSTAWPGPMCSLEPGLRTPRSEQVQA